MICFARHCAILRLLFKHMSLFNRLLTSQHTFKFMANSEDAPLQQACPDLNAVFNLTANHIISKSNQSEIFSYQIGQQQYYIKRYFTTVGFASWFGLSRFRIETQNQLWFNHCKLPAARVVAYGEERFLLKTKRAVLITESVDHTLSLAEIAEQHPAYFKNKIWRDKLMQQSAAILRFFHQNRFCHNDLHWRNILIKDYDSLEKLQIYLIDCPRGRRLTWPFLTYKKFKDLANIDKKAPHYFSRTQRLRFILAYLGTERLRENDKTLVRTILKHKVHRVKRKSREKRKSNGQ